MLRSESKPPLAHYVQAVHAAMRAGDTRRASELAQQAIEQGHEDAHLLTLAAYRCLAGSHHERALALAVRACELAPHNIDALNAAGRALEELGRFAEAVPYFDRAVALAPQDVDLLANAAAAMERARHLQRACELLERAFRLDRRRADIAARLAFIYSNRGDMKKGREFGAAALALDPNQAFASFAIAIADIDEANYDDACARLRAVIAIPRIGRVVCALAQNILGDALDGLGRPEEAFAAYAQGGAELRDLYAPPPGADIELALVRSRRIAAYVSRASAESWTSQGGTHKSPVRTHAFLVSFPRSGTTLLTHVLAAHPQILSLDEPRTLADSADLAGSDAGLDRLAAMREDELDVYRDAYWRRAAAAGFSGSQSVLVEKMPLYSEILCLIAKLFPDAKILFALRDPRDVVFSCFRRRFAFTRQLYELATLEGAAAYYDATMTLAEIYRRKISLPILNIRHDDLVSDFDRQNHAICEFLGVEGGVALDRYAERARLSDISTPNAAQISRGIRRESLGQWRPYAEQMKPVLPLLAPWVEKFGYAD